MKTIYCICTDGRLRPIVPSEFRTIAILRAIHAGLTNFEVKER